MADKEITTGKLISALPEESRRVLGSTIIDGIKGGRFTFTNPLATEGGDYTQGQGDYHQSGGGDHTQGGGGYTQTKNIGNLGHFDITDLAEILGSIEKFER
jgi:hypothetical protein